MSKKLFFKNRKASFNYEIFDKYIAGILLKGTEIKSIRNSLINLNSSFFVLLTITRFMSKILVFQNINLEIQIIMNTKRIRKLLLNKEKLIK